MTNAHLPAQFVGRDLGTDLALLRVTNLGLAAAEAVTETVRVGQLVLAVGRTPEDGPMASSGVVSTVGGPLRTGRGAILERYIRTDATPYPGFSGGPLVDTQGKVAGILTTGLVNGVALAIPMDIATSIADTSGKTGLYQAWLSGYQQPVCRASNNAACRTRPGTRPAYRKSR